VKSLARALVMRPSPFVVSNYLSDAVRRRPFELLGAVCGRGGDAGGMAISRA
jgi:hypothetical protein